MPICIYCFAHITFNMSDKDIQISEPCDRLGVEGQGESQDENLVCQGQEAKVKDRSVCPRTFTERGRGYHIDRFDSSPFVDKRQLYLPFLIKHMRCSVLRY